MSVPVVWKSNGRLEEDANGDPLCKPGDEGRLEEDLAESLQGLAFCEVVDESEPEEEEASPKLLESEGEVTDE